MESTEKQRNRPKREPIRHGPFTDWLDELLFPSEAVCLSCGTVLNEESHLGLCPDCARLLVQMHVMEQLEQEREHLSGIDYAGAAFPYAGEARDLIIRLKFHSVRRAAQPLAEWMCRLPPDGAEMIVPVPTSRKRMKERGYNQAQVLAEQISRVLRLPVRCALYRTAERGKQSELTAEERRTNLVGCMRAKDCVRGKRILLVDDVLTTGSTAVEAARALKEAGAGRIDLVTAAKTRPGLDDERIPFSLRTAK